MSINWPLAFGGGSAEDYTQTQYLNDLFNKIAGGSGLNFQRMTLASQIAYAPMPTFVVPSGVTAMRCRARGGGGMGAGAGSTSGTTAQTGGAGGGAGETKDDQITVTPGSTLYGAIGIGGNWPNTNAGQTGGGGAAGGNGGTAGCPGAHTGLCTISGLAAIVTNINANGSTYVISCTNSFTPGQWVLVQGIQTQYYVNGLYQVISSTGSTITVANVIGSFGGSLADVGTVTAATPLVIANGGGGGLASTANSTAGANGGAYGAIGMVPGGAVIANASLTAGPGAGAQSARTSVPLLSTVGGSGGGSASASNGGGPGQASTTSNALAEAQAAGTAGTSASTAGVNGVSATTPGCGGGGGGGGANNTGAGGNGGFGANGDITLWW